MKISYMTGAISEEGNKRLNDALAKAYDYFTNVTICQKRFLDNKDMIAGYYSMHFKDSLKENILVDLLDVMKKTIEKKINI